jgi:hypothetical protein
LRACLSPAGCAAWPDRAGAIVLIFAEAINRCCQVDRCLGPGNNPDLAAVPLEKLPMLAPSGRWTGSFGTIGTGGTRPRGATMAVLE